MKNAIRLGLAAGLAGALALLGSAQAQQGSSGGSGSYDTATGGGGSSASSGSTMAGAPSAGKKLDQKLQDQLEKIHAGNQGELQMAQLGAQNAQSPEVKQFALKMQSDHTKMDRQLTQQAKTLGVSLEGKAFQKEQQSAAKELQKLQSKTGKDFDKAYMSRMVKDHENDLKEVGKAAKEAQKEKQTELASALQTAHTQIQSHLDSAKQVQKSLSKGGAAASSGASSSGTGSSGTSSDTGSKPPSQ
jgi:putative membrane protein